MNLANDPVRVVPKPSYKRMKKTAKQRGAISKKADQEARKRAQGRCERCGWVEGSYDPTGRRWRLERAHLVRRWKLKETTGKDIALLCGPSTNTGTCHWWVDHTKQGREWAEEYRRKLWGDVSI